MTEEEWLRIAKAATMIEFLGSRATARKLRLFAVACCRASLGGLRHERESMYDVAEAFADGNATVEEVRNRWGGIEERPSWPELAKEWAKSFAKHRARSLRRPRANLVQEIFGNPFRTALFHDTWRTPDVVSLAQAAYEHRSFPGGELDTHRLTVLADALEEVGAAEEVVAHLRAKGPHVRGCWALDIALGNA
jgi:hypothetical protein